MKREKFIKTVLTSLGGIYGLSVFGSKNNEVVLSEDSIKDLNLIKNASGFDSKSIVYMTKDINSVALMKAYKALNRKLQGKVAVKLSSGEPGGHNFLSPDMIKELVQSVKGTIVECNTAYGGGRATTIQHKQVMIDHGFAAIAPTDIMDEDGSLALPVRNGKHLKEDFVGSHFKNYNNFMVLSHFKGHAMGGFGGALKNLSIGIGSAEGKMWIHTAGKVRTLGDFGPATQTPQDDFLESMAEAAGAVMDFMGDKVVYINVMNKLSVDCDCDNSPAPPTMKDIAVLASLDPVALDQACVDLVYKAGDGKDLIERMESRHGIHILEHAAVMGLGNRAYEIVSLD